MAYICCYKSVKIMANLLEYIEKTTSYEFEKEVIKLLNDGYKIALTTIQVTVDFNFEYKAILEKFVDN